MSERPSAKKELYSLKKLKVDLYQRENPILYSVQLTEAGFLELVFPPEFYTKTIEDENGKKYSLVKVLKGDSQRNKVFNRGYDGYVLSEQVHVILKLRPDLWEEICLRCNGEISKAQIPSRVLPALKAIVDAEVRGEDYRKLLTNALTEEPGVALAGLILYLLLDGRVENLLDVVKNTASIANQFSYLEAPTAMLLSDFANCYNAEKQDKSIEKHFDQYSLLFSCVAAEPHGTQSDLSFLENIFQAILRGSTEKLVYLSGAAGMGKNVITQLLYLKLSAQVRAGQHPTAAPYYVNLSFYEELYLKDEASAKERLAADLTPFLEYCRKHPHRIPFLFVDGVKNYTINGCEIDYTLNRIIEKMPRVRLIVAAENGAATNPLRQRRTPGFAAGRFECLVELDSMYLPESKEAKKYLEAFRKIYGPQVSGSIYDRLQELRITHIDTYQLKMLMNRLWEARDIADLYETVCIDFLDGDTSQLPQAAEWAYRFAYTDEKLPPISGKMIQLLTSHESVQEYFIARWYLAKIREGTQQDNIGTLNMVLPKGVTRFVVPMINRSSADENRILRLIEQNYHQMGLMAKSEMTYWLGRICSPGMEERAERFLEDIYEEQKKELAQLSVTDADYRQKLFLLSGISVSLIVKGRADVCDEYLAMLLHNSAANEINRGFHLEYFGDKVYIPVYNNLNFMDDITKGKRTLDQLMTANDLGENEFELPPLFELNLFTICSLIQARMENQNSGITFDLREYMNKARERIDRYLRSDNSQRTTRLFREYLMMMEQDLRERLRQGKNGAWSPIGALVYEQYSRRTERADWTGCSEPETVAEHMYRCWLLGMLYLPQYAPNLKGYSKEKILKMLLIHDIAKTAAGNTPKPERRQDPKDSRREESDQMGVFLLRGSYPGMASMQEEYEIWQAWNDSRDINGRIAHEIDVIQTLFQFLTWASRYPERFQREELQQWMRRRSQVRSAPGTAILKMLILENQSFQRIFDRVGIAQKK